MFVKYNMQDTADVVFREQVGDYTAVVRLDTYAPDPREYENTLGIMVCFHKRYNLPNELDLKSRDFNSWEEIEAFLYKQYGAVESESVFMLDHSGITISTSDFGDPWDSGQVGYIFTTQQKIQEFFPEYKRLTKKRLKGIREILRAEVKNYDSYLRGEVYVVEIKGPDEEFREPWFGYYDLETAKEEALAEARWLAGNTLDKQH